VWYNKMAKLNANARKHIASKNYGITIDGEKKYPMPDASHVRSAISMFAHCPDKYKATLARAIKRRIRELGLHIEVAPGSAFYEYAGQYKKKESKKD